MPAAKPSAKKKAAEKTDLKPRDTDAKKNLKAVELELTPVAKKPTAKKT
jgi:hypothetical protein